MTQQSNFGAKNLKSRFKLRPHLKPEGNAFLATMLLRGELCADAVHLDVDTSVPETKVEHPFELIQ